MQKILVTLVGSRAHGLWRSDSDWDYRGVFVAPNRDFWLANCGLTEKVKRTDWMEAKGEDCTAYEIGHFVHLAMQCNPSVLEVLWGPVIEATEVGMQLRRIRGAFLHPDKILASHLGYAKNQRQKFLEDKDGRPWKFAVAWLRTLLNGTSLLNSGEMEMMVPEVWKTWLSDVRDGRVKHGQIIDWAVSLESAMKQAFVRDETNPHSAQQLGVIEDYIMEVRGAQGS